MYIVICEHNVPSSFIDFMHSYSCFQLFKYIFVKTWIYPQIFKIVKTWKIGKTWISPPKFQNPEKNGKNAELYPPMLNTDRHRWSYPLDIINWILNTYLWLRAKSRI